MSLWLVLFLFLGGGAHRNREATGSNLWAPLCRSSLCHQNGSDLPRLELYKLSELCCGIWHQDTLNCEVMSSCPAHPSERYTRSKWFVRHFQFLNWTHFPQTIWEQVVQCGMERFRILLKEDTAFRDYCCRDGVYLVYNNGCPCQSHLDAYLPIFPSSNTSALRTDSTLTALYIPALDRCHCKEIINVTWPVSGVNVTADWCPS